MVTSIDLSTLTWNSQDFLKGILDKLLDNNQIEYYQYIYHYPDIDSTKDHYHVFIRPACRLDTIILREKFKEEIIGDLPIRPLPFHKTKDFTDWYLYALHDETYLAYKGLVRTNHYSKEQFVYSDFDYFNYMVSTVSFTKYNLQGIVESMVYAGLTFDEIVARKIIPANQVVGYKMIYESMLNTMYSDIEKKGVHNKKSC